MILIFGHDELLLRSRSWLLESKGFRVRTATETRQAAEIITSESIDLMIVCYTATFTECENVMAIAEAVRPRMKTLFLDSTPCLESSGKNIAVLCEFIHPKALITAVQEMTGAPAW